MSDHKGSDEQAEETISDYRDALCAMQAERDRYRAALQRLLAATEHEPDDSDFAGLVDDIARDALGSDWDA